MEGKKINSFEEVGAALGDLTPKQVYYLAKLGQKVLQINGTGLAPQLIGIATAGLWDEAQADLTPYLSALEVAKAVGEVHADELAEGLTLAELTGVTVENEMYGVKKEGGAA